MGEQVVHLYVELCTDGSLLAYNKDKMLDATLTSLHSWNKLHLIYSISKMEAKDKKAKGLPSVKYVNYYFRNVKSGEVLEIPEEHIEQLLYSIKKV